MLVSGGMQSLFISVCMCQWFGEGLDKGPAVDVTDTDILLRSAGR